MSISALIRRMSEAGAPAEAIALAVEEIEALQMSLDARRAADRDRKREQRERLKSANVTGQSEDSPETVTPKGSLEVSPLASPLPKPSKISPFSSPKLKVEIPDWMPASYGEFRTMRKGMRNVPFGEGAERRVIAKIARLRSEGHDPDKLLSKAIERGHRTVFEDDTTKGGTIKRTVEEQIANLKKSIEFFSKINRPDDVAECRRKIAALEGGQGPPQVASIVREATSGLRV